MLKTGIRTEILLNLTLLVGAALLFSCILLVKFSERKLLSQQIESAQNTVRALMQGTLAGENHHQHQLPEDLLQNIDRALQDFRGSDPLSGWVLYNSRLEPLDSLGKDLGRDRARSVT